MPLASVMPAGGGVRAVDGIAYFDHDGLTSGIVVLSVWIALCVAGLFLLTGSPHRRDPASRGRVIGGCNRPRTTYDSMRTVSNPLTSRCSPSWRSRGDSEPSPRTPPGSPVSGGPFCSSGDPAEADMPRPCRALPR